MILISGTTLSKEDLPLNDVVNYEVETNDKFVAIKLKSIASSPVCLGVYLHESKVGEYTISDVVAEKLVYFNSDEHLIKLLENGGKEHIESEPEPEPVVEEEEITFSTDSNYQVEHVIEPSNPIAVDLPSVSSNVLGFNLIETVDVDSEDTDFLIEIPKIEDVDSLRVLLETKERVIGQLEAQLADHSKVVEDLYKLQDIQLHEVKAVYEERVSEMVQALAEADRAVKVAQIPKEYQSFMRYVAYVQNPKASLREGFEQEDLNRIGKLSSKMFVFASGSGDSYFTLMKQFMDKIERGLNAVVVDFSNDPYLMSRTRVGTKDSTLHLINNDIAIESLVKRYVDTDIIHTSVYNDIAILGYDWVEVIKRLQTYAKGRPIVFLFNSINSFSVRHTVSKLSTVAELTLFVKCNPVILAGLFVDRVFIPKERYKIVALEYVDVAKDMLERISKDRNVMAVRKDLDWGKLGLK